MQKQYLSLSSSLRSSLKQYADKKPPHRPKLEFGVGCTKLLFYFISSIVIKNLSRLVSEKSWLRNSYFSCLLLDDSNSRCSCYFNIYFGWLVMLTTYFPRTLFTIRKLESSCIICLAKLFTARVGLFLSPQAMFLLILSISTYFFCRPSNLML